MGRGKRASASGKTTLSPASLPVAASLVVTSPVAPAATLEEVVGVLDNEAYPLSRLKEELTPSIRILRRADGHNQGKTDESEDWETLPTRQLYDDLLPVWDGLWEHYHEARSFKQGSPFDDLLWAVADLCERLDKETRERYSMDLIDPPQARALLEAHDRFTEALEGYERRLLEPQRPGARSRASGLAERRQDLS